MTTFGPMKEKNLTRIIGKRGGGTGSAVNIKVFSVQLLTRN